jgi:high-affinity iron transporter
MFSSAIVVFREVFEIVLIIGIILAATRGMPHRKKAIVLGFKGGLLGAALVALFTDKISGLAEGMGQEYFNAGILFAAAGFIGWTVLWMKRHAREIKGTFTKIGQDVASGDTHYLGLSAVIALALLREGSEIVLFAYGMLAAGQSVLSLATGAAIGLIGGAALGILIYTGLVTLSLRLFFTVTTWLLVFLVAGMASHGAGFLIAAGAFDNLSQIVWNTSWLLDERGILGQSLGTLIGYTAQPTILQVLVYLSTFAVLTALLKLTEKGINPLRFLKTGGAAAVFVLLLTSSRAHAFPQVYSPYVIKGEMELEWKGSRENSGDWQQKAALGYGFTDYWFSEIEGEVENEGNGTSFSALEWENRFQLTSPGEYWVDVGALAEYERNTTGGSDELAARLLLAKDTGKFSHTANFILEREIGDDAEDATEAGFAWSTRYRLREQFEPGFELIDGFGGIGEGEDFDEQDHRLGPVAYGRIGNFKYNAGYLFGISDSAPDDTLKAILEYEWYF